MLKTGSPRVDGPVVRSVRSASILSISCITLLFATCVTLMSATAGRLFAAQIEIPLDLDYLLMDASVKERYYTGPGGAAQFWSGLAGCGHFYATNPRFSRSGMNVQLDTQGDLEAAMTLGEQCLNAASWRGNLVATSTPWIVGSMLKFRLTDLNFYGADGAAIGGAAFELSKNAAMELLGNFSYDLHPQLQQLQAMADELPATKAAGEVKEVVASLRFARQVEPQDDGVRITLQIEVPVSLLSPNNAPLTPAERASFRKAVENVSAFLTTMVTHTQAFMPDAHLRDEVSAIAADCRARATAIANAPPAGGDPLPLFRVDWQRLRAALKSAARRRALHDQTAAVLETITGVDFIFTLDERAPGLGSELSRAGLQQLAHGLSASQSSAP